MGDYLDDEHDSGYTAKLGVRLRSLRRQRHLSLQDVEAASDHEFTASVLGAYERGERAISVPRLQRLGRVYRVPVDQMVPSDEPGMAGHERSSRSCPGTSPDAGYFLVDPVARSQAQGTGVGSVAAWRCSTG